MDVPLLPVSNSGDRKYPLPRRSRRQRRREHESGRHPARRPIPFPLGEEDEEGHVDIVA